MANLKRLFEPIAGLIDLSQIPGHTAQSEITVHVIGMLSKNAFVDILGFVVVVVRFVKTRQIVVNSDGNGLKVVLLHLVLHLLITSSHSQRVVIHGFLHITQTEVKGRHVVVDLGRNLNVCRIPRDLSEYLNSGSVAIESAYQSVQTNT